MVAQCSKQAFLYVLNRETGQPVWPFEERPVEKGTVPGEWYSPTQPFPTKPPAYDRQGLSVNDLIDFTPELRKEALEIVKNYKIGPIFTPPVESKTEGPWATLSMALGRGGSNWPGASFDPETGVVYVSSQAEVESVSLVPAGNRTDTGYISGRAPGARGNLTVQGLPLIKPPYGQISAVDLKTGSILWQIANGDTPDEIRNHPALKGLNIPRTGRIGPVSTLVTRTLMIAGERGFVTMPDGRRGAMMRAYDKATGKELGAIYLRAPQTGGPMTYMIDGRQYLVIAIGGAFTDSAPAEFIAFRLPR
jgi:quinoprotein glucose dehydrogenase